MTPEWLGKKIEVKFYDTMRKALGFSKTLSQLPKPPPFFGELQGIGVASQEFIDFYNSPDTVKAQVPSVNFRGNARGCAKLASIMANKGGLFSLNVFSPQSVFRGEPVQNTWDILCPSL